MVIRVPDGPDPAEEGVPPALAAHEAAKAQAAALSFGQALEWEMARSWPGWRLPRAFWSRADVPAGLHPSAAPDPRQIFTGGPEAAREYSAARAGWLDARRAWLQSMAG